MDEYWGDDGDAPEWRRTMGIGKRIKQHEKSEYNGQYNLRHND